MSKGIKKVKIRAKPSINRRLAQLMVEIQDELRLLDAEIRKSKTVKNKILAKLIIMETKVCLNETLKIVISK